jgi:nucleoside 2-deoxyribosyltransferase
MPFTPELHYFYLYIKHHIQSNHNIRCERADDRVLTQPILDKINALIRDADLIIADCSGRNPNVFYELGIAHALGKKVILITKDPLHDAPSDVRHFEFIHYELDQHDSFLKSLDNALKHIMFEKYRFLYDYAVTALGDFTAARQIRIEQAGQDEFVRRVRSAERFEEIPGLDDPGRIIPFLLPKLIAEPNEPILMNDIIKFYESEEKKTRRKRKQK